MHERVAHAVRLPAEPQEPAVVDDAVDHGGRHPVVAEDLDPPRELEVRRDRHRLPLVGPRDHLEQQARTPAAGLLSCQAGPARWRRPSAVTWPRLSDLRESRLAASRGSAGRAGIVARSSAIASGAGRPSRHLEPSLTRRHPSASLASGSAGEAAPGTGTSGLRLGSPTAFSTGPFSLPEWGGVAVAADARVGAGVAPLRDEPVADAPRGVALLPRRAEVARENRVDPGLVALERRARPGGRQRRRGRHVGHVGVPGHRVAAHAEPARGLGPGDAPRARLAHVMLRPQGHGHLPFLLPGVVSPKVPPEEDSRSRRAAPLPSRARPLAANSAQFPMRGLLIFRCEFCSVLIEYKQRPKRATKGRPVTSPRLATTPSPNPATS